MAKSERDHGCRTAALRLSRQIDSGLPWTERLSLRVHLFMCTGCWNYSQQLKLMQQASQRWRAYSEQADE